MEEEATISCPTWYDLLPDLLGRVIAHLPFPGDRARFRAVCRSWHSAARQHVRQLPWIVFPDCSFCTIGDDGVFFPRIPGLPEKNATCLGAAADAWLALDCTDDVLRWLPASVNMNPPSGDIRHTHTYLLHNPFSGETVPLPQLESIFGHVPETFQIRKVLMRSSSNPNDEIAILSNSRKYNLVLCCRGKKFIVPRSRLEIFDVAFLEDRMYGINKNEDLIAFDLGEDEDGIPAVGKVRRVIKKPVADGEADPWSWLDHDDTDNEEEEEEEGGGGGEEEEDNEEDSFDDNTDGMEISQYETNKGHIVTIRRLVTSHGGSELLMVRREIQVPPRSDSYTRKVQVFKADMNAGNWVSSSMTTSTTAVDKGEALFLSRSSCMSTRGAFGDIKEGLIYFLDTNQVFDTNSWDCKPFSLPQRTKLEAQEFMTWLFPPKLVL